MNQYPVKSPDVTSGSHEAEQKSILAKTRQCLVSTLAFFDLFDYPMTADEVWQNLVETRRGASLQDVEKFLDVLIKQNVICKKDNWHFLSGRDEIVETRKERHKESLRKIKRAQKMVRFLSVLPFIKMVAVCNVLGYLNAKEEDDIDFFIITNKNRIWLARWWSAGFAKLLRLRPRPKKIKNKFCFSFYVTEDNLNLQNVTLDKDDIYFYYWITQMIPIYDQGGYFEKFINSNKWVLERIPNRYNRYNRYKDIKISSFVPSNGTTADKYDYKIRPVAPMVKLIWEKTSLNMDEKMAKRLQMIWMPRKIKNKIGQDKGVIVNDQILKFHLIDRRRDIKDKWQQRISNF